MRAMKANADITHRCVGTHHLYRAESTPGLEEQARWQELHHMFDNGYTFHGRFQGILHVPVGIPDDNDDHDDHAPGTADSR